MSKKCEECGKEVLPEWKYCPECGRAVNSNTYSDLLYKTGFSILINDEVRDAILDNYLYALPYKKENFLEAINYFKRAAELGNAEAQFMMGWMHYKGYEKICKVDGNVLDAVSWFRKAAEQGNAAALYYLGCCYHDSIGVEENLKKAISYWTMSAEQNYEPAQIELDYIAQKEGKKLPYRN